MTPVEQQEMVDAINLQSARIARLEDTLREVLESTTELNRAVAVYIGELHATHTAVLEAQRRPWWRW